MEKVFITEKYTKNEFCKNINCEELNKNNKDCSNCLAYKFHDYLNNNNYSIVKIQDNFICGCDICSSIKSK